MLALLASLRPGRSWGARAENLYISAFTIAVIVGLFWGLSKRAGSLFVEVAGFYHFVWGPPLIVLIFLGAFRYSTVQGFVSFSEPDCLLPPAGPSAAQGPGPAAAGSSDGASGRRRSARRGPDRGGLGGGAIPGSESGRPPWPALRWECLSLRGVGTCSGCAGRRYGRCDSRCPLSASPSFSRSPRSEATRLNTPVSGRARGAGPSCRWTGSVVYGVVALVLLCALAAAAAVSLFRTAGDCSTESFRMRARTRSQVVASLYALDYRSVAVAGRGDKAQTWQARVRLPLPRRPVLIVPWHGAVALLRSPVRLGWGIVLAGAGTFLLALQPTRQGALWAGAVALYLAATSLLEPLRLEVDASGTAKVLLPWRFEKVLWLHCLLPAMVMIAAGFLSLAGGLALGYLTGAGAAAVAMLAIPLSFVVISRRGPVCTPRRPDLKQHGESGRDGHDRLYVVRCRDPVGDLGDPGPGRDGGHGDGARKTRVIGGHTPLRGLGRPDPPRRRAPARVGGQTTPRGLTLQEWL